MLVRLRIFESGQAVNYANMTFNNVSNLTMCTGTNVMATNLTCQPSVGGGGSSGGGYLNESEWPLERVVSMVVPVFFGIIGLIGLMGNALVIIGTFSFHIFGVGCI